MKTIQLYKQVRLEDLKPDLKKFGFDYYLLLFLSLFTFKSKINRLKWIYTVLVLNSFILGCENLYTLVENEHLKNVGIFDYKKDVEYTKIFLTECEKFYFNCSIKTVLETVKEISDTYINSILIFKENGND